MSDTYFNQHNLLEYAVVDFLDCNDMTALIIVDTQNDFFDKETIYNHNATTIIPEINDIKIEYPVVIFCLKSNPNNHCSFIGYGGKEQPHCIVNSNGHKIHSCLLTTNSDYKSERNTIQKYNSTSAFYNSPIEMTNLKSILDYHRIKNLIFCGNNFETTIFSTIMDAMNMNYKCAVISSAVGYRQYEKYEERVQFLSKNRVLFL